MNPGTKRKFYELAGLEPPSWLPKGPEEQWAHEGDEARDPVSEDLDIVVLTDLATVVLGEAKTRERKHATKATPRKKTLAARLTALESASRAREVENRELRGRIEELEQEIQGLRAETASAEPAIDPVLDWMERHWDEYRKFAGQHVAIHPEQGIVDHAASSEELLEKIRRRGLLNQVQFDFVAEHG